MLSGKRSWTLVLRVWDRWGAHGSPRPRRSAIHPGRWGWGGTLGGPSPFCFFSLLASPGDPAFICRHRRASGSGGCGPGVRGQGRLRSSKPALAHGPLAQPLTPLESPTHAVFASLTSTASLLTLRDSPAHLFTRSLVQVKSRQVIHLSSNLRLLLFLPTCSLIHILL